MKFAFYVSNRATRLIKGLQFFAIAYPSYFKDIEFVLIDNIENSTLRQKCSEYSIDLMELDLSEHPGKKRGLWISDYIDELLERRHADYLFIFCDKLLKGRLLSKFANRIINFHPSLLPHFKGLNAIDQALEMDVRILGNTAHFVTAEVDGGPIIMQSLFPRDWFQNYDDVLDLQVPMLAQIIDWLQQGRICVNETQIAVKDADYRIGQFIPALDSPILDPFSKRRFSQVDIPP